MELKKIISEFTAMLDSCEGDIPKLSRLLRNKYGLNQATLGRLTGLHRNAVIRLESGKYSSPGKWKRELFYVLLLCNDKSLYKDILSLRDYGKKKTPIGITEENSGFFKDFITRHADSGENIPELSKAIRKKYNLIQEDLAELLGADRTTVSQLEGGKHKYPDRLLADLYFSTLFLNEPELKEYVLSLGRDKVKKTRVALEEKKPYVSVEMKSEEEAVEYSEDKGIVAAEETVVPAFPPDSMEMRPVTIEPKIDIPEDEVNLKKYGFRTRQELYNATRFGETLEEKRRLDLINTQWEDDLKKEGTRKLLRTQMKALKDRIMRELFDRTANNQTAFLRASNGYRKGLSIAEIASENNGYFSLPFCNVWEKQGFNLVKFLAWKPTEKDAYEIYKDYEPEFKINTLEYKFRPRKTPKAPVEAGEMSLNTLLKEWFPQLAEEIGRSM